MTKLKFNVRGIVGTPKASKNTRDSFDLGVVVRWGVIGFVGLCAMSLLFVFEGEIFPKTLSSVINAFEKVTEVEAEPVVEQMTELQFDKNLKLSFNKAPIQHAIPRAKIDNALSFEIENPTEDFKFKGIKFAVGKDGCSSIKRAYLIEEGGSEKYYGQCKNDKIEIRSLDRDIRAGEKVTFVLGVSLSTDSKIGQHVNFSINNPRDIEASIGFKNIYFFASYPFNVSTIYVVGLQQTF